MDPSPLISVVVAAYNEERLLPRCLAALAAQATARSFEILVVDNGSTDRTAEVAAAVPGVRVLAHPVRGAVHAKAAGVRGSTAPLVAVIDADSVCPADWLERIGQAFEADPELVGLSGPARYPGASWWVSWVMFLWYGYWKLVQGLAGRAFYAVGTNVAFRREAYERAGGYDTKVLVGGDELAFFHRLRRVGITRYTDSLTVDTDPRRTEVGFLRFFVGTVLRHYVFNYLVYRITGRSLLKDYRPGSTL